MSTSLLYHAFGIRGFQQVREEYVNGEAVFTIRQDQRTFRCAACGSWDVICRGQIRREFRTVPIGRKPVKVVLGVQRVGCRKCAAVRQVELEFADERRGYTRAFERYALELSRVCTIQDVAKHLGVSWDTIKDIQKRYLQRRFSRPKLKGLQWIAIDEICIGRGHRYLTVVLDLKSGAVVFVGDGKGVEALSPFWARLKRSRARIKAVAMDMGPAYIEAVSTHLPEATIVFDHFHVIKLFNDKLSDLRRRLIQEAESQLHRQVLKGTRWLLLKNPENLDESRNEKARLEEALRLNQPLMTVYYMKEELRQLWKRSSKESARRLLRSWIRKAEASGVMMLKKFAVTLASHRTGILAWYDFPISTGPLEDTNNKIKTMQRQAYGFRDLEFFKLKILGIHEAKYALVG